MSDVRVIFQRVVLAIFLLGTVLLLAFGPRSITLPPEAKGRVVVTYWEKWNGNEGRAMQKIVDQFNNGIGNDGVMIDGKKERIYVQYLSLTTVDQKTLVATASGIPPDIAGLWAEDVAQFATQDAIEPLDDMVAAYAKEPGGYTIDKNYYKPVYWDGCHYDGKLYALVSTCACVALHYDKKLFMEHGLDPNKPPQTIDELDQDAQKLDQWDADHNKLTLTGYAPGVPGWYLQNTPVWFGGNWYDEKNQKITLTDPGVVKAFEWIESYAKRLGTQGLNAFQSSQGTFDSPTNPFMVNKLAMEQQGPWMANMIRNDKLEMDRWNLPASTPDLLSRSERADLLSGDPKILAAYCQTYHLTPETIPPPAPMEERREHCEWAAAPFPSNVPGQKDVAFATWDVFMIPKGVKHKKEAFAFMAYVNSQPIMEELSDSHSKNSPLAKVSPDFIKNHKNPYISVFEELASSTNTQHAPECPILQNVNAELIQVAQKAMLMKEEPKQALEEAQYRLQDELDQYWAIYHIRHPGTM